jgi:hypothetical protein
MLNLKNKTLTLRPCALTYSDLITKTETFLRKSLLIKRTKG